MSVNICIVQHTKACITRCLLDLEIKAEIGQTRVRPSPAAREDIPEHRCKSMTSDSNSSCAERLTKVSRTQILRRFNDLHDPI